MDRTSAQLKTESLPKISKAAFSRMSVFKGSQDIGEINYMLKNSAV